MKKVLEGKTDAANTASTPDMSKEVPKLCAYIQAVDHQKIQDFFGELEKSCAGAAANIRDIQLECIVLTMETRFYLCNKIPALKEVMSSSKEILDAIMRAAQLPDIMKVVTDDALQISNCLPLLSADNNIQRIVGYVNSNYNEDLKLKSLGHLFNYNPAYLGKRFKQHTGKGLHTYLDMLRIDKAKEMLLSTNMKVYEISFAVGYSNTDYFYSKFRKYAGSSPLVYKGSKGAK